MRKATLLLPLLFLAGHILAQKLTSVEKKIVDAVNSGMPETFALLKDMVNINSGSKNVAGVKQTGELARAGLNKLGFSTEWIMMPDSVKNAGHLVGRITETRCVPIRSFQAP